MQVIPAVDVLDGSVVRLLRGDYEAVTSYGADPVRGGWVDNTTVFEIARELLENY